MNETTTPPQAPTAPAATGRPRRAAGYIPTLDGWRTIAVLMVIYAHVIHHSCDSRAGWCATLAAGDHGVNLFFGISGFLICSRLLDERAAFGQISLGGFYIRRAFRILPAACAYLLVLALIASTTVLEVGPGEWFAALLFYRNYVPILGPHHEGVYTAHYWSLAVEEHFYLIWPALLWYFGPRRGVWVALALAFLTAVWRRLDAHFLWVQRGLDLPWQQFNRTDARLDALLYGCVLALLLARPEVRAAATRWLSPGRWALVFLAWLAIVLYWPGVTLPAIVVPLLLVGPVLHSSSAVGRFLELPAMRYVGRLSYSLYLWQQFFLAPLGPRPFGAAQRPPLALALLVLAALASYYLIERPMLRLGHRVAPPATPGREDAESHGTEAAKSQASASAGRAVA